MTRPRTLTAEIDGGSAHYHRTGDRVDFRLNLATDGVRSEVANGPSHAVLHCYEQEIQHLRGVFATILDQWLAQVPEVGDEVRLPLRTRFDHERRWREKDSEFQVAGVELRIERTAHVPAHASDAAIIQAIVTHELRTHEQATRTVYANILRERVGAKPSPPTHAT